MSVSISRKRVAKFSGVASEENKVEYAKTQGLVLRPAHRIHHHFSLRIHRIHALRNHRIQSLDTPDEQILVGNESFEQSDRAHALALD